MHSKWSLSKTCSEEGGNNICAYFQDTKEQASQGNVSRIQMDEAAGLNKAF